MKSRFVPTLLTVAIAIAGAATLTGAYAMEATQFNPEPGTAARGEVQGELNVTHTASGVVQLGEATVFVDQPSTLTRTAARADADTGATQVVQLGEATQFVDRPGVRSRTDVTDETLAAARAPHAR